MAQADASGKELHVKWVGLIGITQMASRPANVSEQLQESFEGR